MLRTQFTNGVLTQLYFEQDGKCYFCSREIHLLGGLHPLVATKDHLQPASKGGSSRKENLAAACYQCNNVKDNNDEATFVAMLAEHNGDIHALTLAVRGERKAAAWKRSSDSPVPEQPPLYWPIQDHTSKLRLGNLLRHPEGEDEQPNTYTVDNTVPAFSRDHSRAFSRAGDWKVSVWNIKTQQRHEMYVGSIERARKVAVRYVINDSTLSGDLGWACLKVSNLFGTSHLYKSGSSWKWTPMPKSDKLPNFKEGGTT